MPSLFQRPLNLLVADDTAVKHRHRLLLLWYCEHELKSKYAQFVDKLKVSMRGGNDREAIFALFVAMSGWLVSVEVKVAKRHNNYIGDQK